MPFLFGSRNPPMTFTTLVLTSAAGVTDADISGLTKPTGRNTRFKSNLWYGNTYLGFHGPQPLMPSSNKGSPRPRGGDSSRPTYRTGNLVHLYHRATEIEGQLFALVLYLFHRMQDLDVKFAVWFEFAREDFRPPATEVIIVGSIPMCAVYDQNGYGVLTDPGSGERVPPQMIDWDNGSSCLMNGFLIARCTLPRRILSGPVRQIFGDRCRCIQRH